jgi:hypothetical protein
VIHWVVDSNYYDRLEVELARWVKFFNYMLWSPQLHTNSQTRHFNIISHWHSQVRHRSSHSLRCSEKLAIWIHLSFGFELPGVYILISNCFTGTEQPPLNIAFSPMAFLLFTSESHYNSDSLQQYFIDLCASLTVKAVPFKWRRDEYYFLETVLACSQDIGLSVFVVFGVI